MKNGADREFLSYLYSLISKSLLFRWGEQRFYAQQAA
jgi:hypothetical protein